MPPIVKLKIQLTVLMPESRHGDLNTMSLAQLVAEMDGGDFVGDHVNTYVGVVPPGNVTNELLAVGNDGTFFDGLQD